MDPSSALPPDPYRALSISRTASPSEIKSAYRKLALKCHPDKAPDRADEFVRIQQAYEILSDDDKRRQYDHQYAQEVKLDRLKEELARSRGGDSARTNAATAEYGGGGRWPPPGVQIRTATTSFSFGVGRDGKGSTTFWSSEPAPRSGVREESRRTRSPESRHSDDGFVFGAATAAASMAAEYFLNRKRNSETQRSSSQRKSSRSEEAENARSSRSSRDAQKEQERERERKNREKQQARERSHKYSSYRPTVDSDSDDDTYQEKQREQTRRRSLNEEKVKYEQEKMRKRRESSARDNHNPYFDDRSSRFDDRSSRVAAEDYIRQSKTPTSPNPPPLSRSSTYVYEDRHTSNTERPSLSRRTSTRQPEPRLSPKRDDRYASERRSSESVDGPSSRRTSSRAQAPPLNTSYTSPPDLRSPKSASPTASRRAHTFDIQEDQRYPQPGLRRAQTMPVEPEIRRATTSRHNTRDTAPERGSNLRYGETNDSGYSTSSPSEEPEPHFRPQYKQSSKYAAPSAYMDEDVRRFMESEKRPSPSRQPSQSRKSPDRERGSEKPIRPTINTRAPPVSRSASYAKQHIDEPSSPIVSSATSARRPSLSRADSLRRDTNSTRATSYSEAPRSPATPLKTNFGASYFDTGVTSSPVDYTSARDPFRGSERDRDRDSQRNRENVKRSAYSYAPAADSPKSSKYVPDDASSYDIPIRDARPSMSSRRTSVREVKSPIYDEIRREKRGGSGERERDRDDRSVYEDRRPTRPRRTSGLFM